LKKIPTRHDTYKKRNGALICFEVSNIRQRPALIEIPIKLKTNAKNRKVKFAEEIDVRMLFMSVWFNIHAMSVADIQNFMAFVIIDLVDNWSFGPNRIDDSRLIFFCSISS
jgi:hypothetical protein